MPEPQRHHRHTAAAPADFLASGRAGATGVPDILAASWQRSQAAGVDVEHPRTAYTDAIDTDSRLVRCAQPVLDRLRSDMADTPIAIAMTDSRARVVVRVDTSADVGRRLDRVEFCPGFDYAESTMGTNGVGTVIEAGQAVSVVGAEHFTEHLRPFACTGAPIVDPLTGRIEGILDVSTLSESWSPLMPALVKSAAQEIARNLLLDRNSAQQALFEAYLRADARSTRQAVMAFADSVFMANSAAEATLSAAEQVAIREHASFLLGHRDTASDAITLSTGRTVHLRSTRVVAGIDTAGVVVTADVVAGHEIGRTAILRRRDPVHGPPSEAGSSPAWRRARDELRPALVERRPTLVQGESGTGRGTLVTELFLAEQPRARSVVLDVTQLDEHDILPLLNCEAGEATLCVLRHLDRADHRTVQLVESLLTHLADDGLPVSVAATLADDSLEADLPFRDLLPHFEVAVTVPPLRCRTEDLGAIIGRLTAELAPGRRVQLSPAALRTISRYPWPGNITQLREALTHALRVRPVGEVQEQDLPSYCHTATTKTLTVLESAERDALVAALRDHDGNRAAAAKHVGMSRSSLYRKIKAYGITA